MKKKGAETRSLQGVFSQRLGVCWDCRHDTGVCQNKTSAHKKPDSGIWHFREQQQERVLVFGSNCGEEQLIFSYVANHLKCVGFSGRHLAYSGVHMCLRIRSQRLTQHYIGVFKETKAKLLERLDHQKAI